MATSKRSLSEMKSLSDLKNGGGKKGKKPSDEQLAKFGQFAGTDDTKEQAKYLMKKGLIGAEQLYTDHPDISSKEGILNAQSDWKASAISKMLIRARALGIKTPTEVKANQEALLGSLDDRYRQAIKHPAFNQIHPNFISTFSSILQDRYDNESAQMPSTPTPNVPLAVALNIK